MERWGATFPVLWTFDRFRRIFAKALRAIRKLVRVATFPTAVTAVPATAAVVIAIVATLVTFPSRGCAFPAALFLRLFLRWVQTFAVLTVIELALVATRSATITSVPVTPAIVVFIITSFVPDILLGTTMAALGAAGLFFWLGPGIGTFGSTRTVACHH